jgi:hypothetical protein
MSQHLSDLRVDRRQFDPAHEAVRLHFRSAEDGFASLAVFSTQEGWAWNTGEYRVRVGANMVIWYGRDSCGGRLPPGEYTLAVFGFNVQHAPSGDLPLRVAVSIVPHTQVGTSERRSVPFLPTGQARRRGLLSIFRRS